MAPPLIGGERHGEVYPRSFALQDPWRRAALLLVMGYVVAGCQRAGPHAPMPSLEDTRIIAAERFADAFYAFDRARLAREVDAADSAAARILYYQGWAEGGNYRVRQRHPCALEAEDRVRCAITVADDLIPALGLRQMVTDTFRLTIQAGRIRHVTTSSNDPPILRRPWLGLDASGRRRSRRHVADSLAAVQLLVTVSA